MQIQCPECGAVSPEDSNFCNKCGAPLVWAGNRERAPLPVAGRPKGRPKWLMIVAAVVALCVVLSCIGAMLSRLEDEEVTPTTIVQDRAAELPSATQGPPPTATPIPPTDTPGPPTETPPPTATSSPQQRLESAVAKALGSGNRDLLRLQKAEIQGGTINIVWTINNSLTENMIRTGAQLDLVDILEAVDQTGIDYNKVIATGSFPMTDAYGNTEEEAVVSMGYQRATIERIQWDSFLFDNVYLIADELIYIHPAFIPQ